MTGQIKCVISTQQNITGPSKRMNYYMVQWKLMLKERSQSQKKICYVIIWNIILYEIFMILWNTQSSRHNQTGNFKLGVAQQGGGWEMRKDYQCIWGSLLGWWKYSKINCADGCTTVNMLKITELFSTTGWIIWYVNISVYIQYALYITILCIISIYNIINSFILTAVLFF